MCSQSRAIELQMRNLIAAMPVNTESVIAYDLRALMKDGSPARVNIAAGLAELARAIVPEDKARAAAIQAILKARPVYHVEGGSNFTPPRGADGKPGGVGAGNHRALSIWYTEDPIVIDAPFLGSGLRHRVVDGFTLYEGEQQVLANAEGPPVKEPLFIVIIDLRTVVMAESLSDAQSASKSLRAKDAEVPLQWRAIAKGIDLTSPLFVLRRFDKENTADLFNPALQWQLDGMSLVFCSFSRPEFDITVHGHDKAAAMLGYDEFFEESGAWAARTIFDEGNVTAARFSATPLSDQWFANWHLLVRQVFGQNLLL